ncbi:hypothetical protein [Williamsia sp.]|uniref:hypothetical protein n=1 Tax=Williamsia sp. TaxID=1872085 RepID=UPI001A25D574|nr:hypothetical protein [Williamsia sp.]MBJ7289408.1 hypothetical protein [Williamsia sp.]
MSPDATESTVETIPANPATALYNILSTIAISNPTASITDGWQAALGVPAESVDFTRLHAEVVGLFSSVCTCLRVNSELWTDYSEYTNQWYRGVIFPGDWGHPASELFPNIEVLKQLRGLGNNLKYAGIAGGQWNADVKIKLNKLIEMWNGVLGKDSLPSDVARDIHRRLDELIWLASQIRHLGIEPVAMAGNQLLMAGDRALVREKLPKNIKKTIIKAMAASLIFVGAVDEGTDHVAGILTNTNKIIEQVEVLKDEQRQLEKGPPKQLESGRGAQDSSEANDEGPTPPTESSQ